MSDGVGTFGGSGKRRYYITHLRSVGGLLRVVCPHRGHVSPPHRINGRLFPHMQLPKHKGVLVILFAEGLFPKRKLHPHILCMHMYLLLSKAWRHFEVRRRRKTCLVRTAWTTKPTSQETVSVVGNVRNALSLHGLVPC